MGDEEYRALQNVLVARPDAGKRIQGSGGLRKLRWSGLGKGKRGGVRIIYYWHRKKAIILMLLVFAKKERSDLTQDQLKVLKSIVEKEFK